MVSSKVLSLLRLFQARLSRRIVLWIFASIVGIEFVVLIPSYYLERQRQLEKLEIDSNAAIRSITSLANQDSSSTEFKRKVATITRDSPNLKGIAIYTDNGIMWSYGEIPELNFESLQNDETLRYLSQDKNRYDIAWSAQISEKNYALVGRHDASEVRGELQRYIVRIAGIVLLISVFVTSVTMIVLGITVINPILRLRDDLKRAGDALSRDCSDCKFYSLDTQRRDELGEVMQAFTEMFERVAREIYERKAASENLEIEKSKSEKLLLNILPKPIAEQLKEKQGNIAQEFPEVTILFADIVGFTQLSSSISPEALVSLLNQIFSGFDRLTEKHNLEKIKTIGDSYMVAGGLPLPQPNHAGAIAEIALDMQAEISQFQKQHEMQLNIRIGINTGPVVAGVIGTKKFIYDLWGDAVNVASRMESHGIPGCIQVTEQTYQLLRDRYQFQERGCLGIKGKGVMKTYLLVGRNI